MPENTKETKPTELELRIKRVDNKNLEYIFVNDVVINHDKNLFFMRLSQAAPPEILDKQDYEELEQQGAIFVPTVGKYILTPDFLPIVIKVLQENYENYKKTHQAENDDDTTK